MDNIELITQYLLNTDEDFDGNFEFLTQGLVKEEKDLLKDRFADKLKLARRSVKILDKGIITVFGNGEFASELAYVIGEIFKKNTLLIDSDRLNPTVDIHLNLPKTNKRIRNSIKGNPESGLGLVIDIINKNMMTHDLMDEFTLKKSGTRYLKIIHGDHELDNYEYYNMEGYEKLLDIAREKYDYLVLSVNDFIYDGYTCHSLVKADRVVTPCKKNLLEVNKFNKYIDFLHRKQDIQLDRFKFVAFDTRKGQGIGDDLMAQAVCGEYLGSISISHKRYDVRNLKRAYAMQMTRQNKREYVGLCKALGIRR